MKVNSFNDLFNMQKRRAMIFSSLVRQVFNNDFEFARTCDLTCLSGCPLKMCQQSPTITARLLLSTGEPGHKPNETLTR